MGILSGELSQRPVPLAMLYDNTTVQGRWIHVDNMTEISQKYSTRKYNRTVTNVTMAMPHAGIFAATRDPINNILQPQDLNVSFLTSSKQVTGDNVIAGARRVQCACIYSISKYQCSLC